MAIQGTGCAHRVEDDALTPDNEVSARQEHKLLATATGLLPAREREMLRLDHEEGETFREIGGHLEVSESRVSPLHTRAIQNLRSTLST